MLRSLQVRFILANVLVVIMAVTLTALLASQTTGTELQQYMERGDIQRYRRFAGYLGAVYRETGGWGNVQPVLEQMSQVTGERLAIADSSGKIVGDSGYELVGKSIPLNRIQPVGRIYVEGVHVGNLLINPERAYPMVDHGFLSSVNNLVLMSAGVAGLVAILVTLALSRRIVQPVVALTAATRRMEKGDLSARVAVTSNDEIGELARSFNAMADGLARLEQLRRHMVNDAAHELRTPLTNLRGYLEAAREKLVTPDAQWLESLYEETMLLNRLVDDLQDLALAEAHQLRLVRQPVDIADLARSALDAIRPQAEGRGLHLALHVPPDLPLVDADPTRIRQVLQNLLSNALDFTPSGGEVAVTMRADDHWVKVEIHDTGCGIAPEHLPFVFERFYRVDASRARSTGGSGLGLTIVKNLVEAHGGRVWVESTVGRGSTFGFSLPVFSLSETGPVRRSAA
jgi:signal transduction histidine kinase